MLTKIEIRIWEFIMTIDQQKNPVKINYSSQKIFQTSGKGSLDIRNEEDKF